MHMPYNDFHIAKHHISHSWAVYFTKNDDNVNNAVNFGVPV